MIKYDKYINVHHSEILRLLGLFLKQMCVVESSENDW